MHPCGRYDLRMTASVDFTIFYEDADEDGWIVAQVLEVPGALSQGRTREEARVNVLDALATVLTPDEEHGGNGKNGNVEHLRFVATA
jgi:predicted RNase H-like HicB family nuclease